MAIAIYGVVKSFQFFSFAPNSINSYGFHVEFVYKTSQSNFNWVKGFVFPPIKYDLTGIIRVSRVRAFIVSESYL